MALDLENKDMSTGQVVLSTYDITTNAINVTGTLLQEIADNTSGGGSSALTQLSGESINEDYSVNNVTTSTYLELSASIGGNVKEIEVFSSTSSVLSLAFGAMGSEINQVMIFPGGNGRMPVQIPMGTRLSIMSTNVNATSGNLVMNFYV